METIWLFKLPLVALVGALLYLLGRNGNKRLRTSELALLVAVALVVGVLVSGSAIFGVFVSLLGGLAVELAIGLIWIGVRKRYPTSQSGTRAAAFLSNRKGAPGSSFATTRHSPNIFLCYRRGESSDVTGRIYDRLVQHFGQESIFKDVDSIPLGVDFRKHLTDSVAQCQLLLAVIGERWIGEHASEEKAGLNDPRDFVRIEVESALQRRIPVIPVLVQGASLPQEGELPESLQVLAYHNAISVRPDPDFHSDIARLIKGIEYHLSG